MNRKMKTAIIGSGMISKQYLKNMMHYFTNLEVVACSSANMEHARQRAEEFGLEARTNEEIFADPEIEMVVVLTPAPTHAALIEQALQAGKHVYTEKTMTVELEDAKHLLELAEEKDLSLGSAPDTFLGAAWQSARSALDEGLIGEPLSFSININRDMTFLAGLFLFLQMKGGGYAYDYGVYYLTALVSLLGPADSLFAVVKNKAEVRTNCAPESPDYGKPYRFENESQIYAVMNLENGVTGTVSMNGDSVLQDLAVFYIYGTKGILKLTCANDFDGEVLLIPNAREEGAEARRLESQSPLVFENRGIGPAEMADAIRQGRPHRASKEMAYHVLDIISQMMKSSELGQMVKVESTCTRPEPLTLADIARITQ